MQEFSRTNRLRHPWVSGGIACNGDIPRDEIKARIDSATRKLAKQRKWSAHLDSRSRLVLQADDDIGANDLPWFDISDPA